MKRRTPQSGNRGFTLVEFIVYFVVLGIVLTAVTSFMFDVMQTRARVRLSAEVEQDMRLSMQRVLRAIRTSESLDEGNSVFDDPDGVLSLTMSSTATDPTVFDIADGILRITEGANPPQALTTDDVTVARFLVERDNLAGGARSVTVQIQIRSLDSGDGPSFEYVSSASSTAVIRRQR